MLGCRSRMDRPPRRYHLSRVTGFYNSYLAFPDSCVQFNSFAPSQSNHSAFCSIQFNSSTPISANHSAFCSILSSAPAYLTSLICLRLYCVALISSIFICLSLILLLFLCLLLFDLSSTCIHLLHSVFPFG